MQTHITLDLSPSNPLHLAFIKWKESASSLDITSAMICGYSIINSDLLNNINRENSNVEEEQEKKIAMLRKEQIEYISRLRQQYDKDIDCYRNKIEEHSEKWIAKYEAISQEYKSYIQRNLDDSKNNEIKELKAQLNIFQSTNSYKGSIGEKQIKDILIKNFIGYEVKDTSSHSNMSDIHLVDREGGVIVIESKNKITITPQDVTKSQNDIKTIKARLGDKFVGYLFASIKSNNIPKKGDIYFEIIEGKPVIWYGTDNHQLLESDIIKMIKLIYMYKSNIRDTDDYDDNINNIIEVINTCMNRISDTRKIITGLRTNINYLQDALELTYNDMAKLVGSTTTTNHNVCPFCQTLYKTKGGLDRHLKTKHQTDVV
jgi:hypothetical protein